MYHDGPFANDVGRCVPGPPTPDPLHVAIPSNQPFPKGEDSWNEMTRHRTCTDAADSVPARSFDLVPTREEDSSPWTRLLRRSHLCSRRTEASAPPLVRRRGGRMAASKKRFGAHGPTLPENMSVAGRTNGARERSWSTTSGPSRHTGCGWSGITQSRGGFLGSWW